MGSGPGLGDQARRQPVHPPPGSGTQKRMAGPGTGRMAPCSAPRSAGPCSLAPSPGCFPGASGARVPACSTCTPSPPCIPVLVPSPPCTPSSLHPWPCTHSSLHPLSSLHPWPVLPAASLLHAPSDASSPGPPTRPALSPGHTGSSCRTSPPALGPLASALPPDPPGTGCGGQTC